MPPNAEIEAAPDLRSVALDRRNADEVNVVPRLNPNTRRRYGDYIMRWFDRELG